MSDFLEDFPDNPQCGCGAPIRAVTAVLGGLGLATEWVHLDPQLDHHHQAELQLEFPYDPEEY